MVGAPRDRECAGHHSVGLTPPRLEKGNPQGRPAPCLEVEELRIVCWGEEQMLGAIAQSVVESIILIGPESATLTCTVGPCEVSNLFVSVLGAFLNFCSL